MVDKMSGPKYNILIIHSINTYPTRVALWDHLYCFRQYSNHNCFYLNLKIRSVPRYIRRIKFDLIIFGTVFLANRIEAGWFIPMLERARALKSSNAVKIALPQDEHTYTNVLMDFYEEFKIDAVFSLGRESDLRKLYDRLDFERMNFHTVLPGYLSDATVQRIERLAANTPERDLDIGYRTWRAGPWLGRHGLLRHRIADLFQERARARGLVTDISTRIEDTILGDGWYKFLLRCKYTIGVEGGSTLADRDGRLKERIEEYQRLHPTADFDEIEAACFPGLDGEIQHVVLTPRHLEACATRTCQVLIEGEYDGILKPGQHYIELKRDFSNIEEVLDLMECDRVRREMTERAYREIVASGDYSYHSFVEFVLSESLKGREPLESGRSVYTTLCYYWMRFSEAVSWLQIALNLHSFIPRLKVFLRKALVSLFSEQAVESAIERIKPKKRAQKKAL